MRNYPTTTRKMNVVSRRVLKFLREKFIGRKLYIVEVSFYFIPISIVVISFP